MKRQPKSDKARATREAILAASSHILLTSGIDSLNTNLVAAKAGVSIGSLYQYFSTKEEILSELLVQVIESRQARVRESINVSLVTKSLEDIIDITVNSIFAHSTQEELKLEFTLLPLVLNSQVNREAMTLVRSEDRNLRTSVKALLIAKRPSLLKRNINALSFLIIQTIRGCIVGLSIEKNIEKNLDFKVEELKTELKRSLGQIIKS